MNEIIKRFTSESPTFFKRIQAIGIVLGSVGLAIIGLPSTVSAVAPSIVIVLPSIVTTLAGYFIAIGAVAAAVAKTTVVDTTVLNK